MTIPLGAHAGPNGTTFAVFAANADQVDLALFNDDRQEIRRIPMERNHRDVWLVDVPEVGAGARYGYRVHGPWAPVVGHRHNPHKITLDPYARAIDGPVVWSDHLFAHEVDGDWNPIGWLADVQSASDSAGFAPLGVVTAATEPHRTFLNTPWRETVIYEAHVKGLTMRHPQVPESLRGTYSGACHPVVIEHLKSLGVTAIELLPVHAIGDEVHLVRRGRHNYWGYNTLNYFSPEPRYVSDMYAARGPFGVLDEFGDMVQTFHEAGIEVLLDVVYNHTCEGGVGGPSLSWRGMDNATYYRLNADGTNIDFTGCGNTLDFRRRVVTDMALDSLRHWVTTFGVDGFRFDLAPALARDEWDYSPDHAFLAEMRTDPVLSARKLIVEPWDIGPNGWRTGQFPTPMAEWNDRFRDDVRSFWLEDAAIAARLAPEHRSHGVGAGVGPIATRLAGSRDFFNVSDSIHGDLRPVFSSINFVTAHDGFTLADVTAFDHKHNMANGEDNRDGSTHNRSWNHGFEGIFAPNTFTQRRFISMRALLATLFFSQGVPMLLAGDEFGNSQFGNNNPYCLDDPTSWIDWSWLGLPEAGHESAAQLPTEHLTYAAMLPGAVRALTQLRKELITPPEGEFAQLHWYSPTGEAMSPSQWQDPRVRGLQLVVGWDSDPNRCVVTLNGDDTDCSYRLPDRIDSADALWDSSFEDPTSVAGRIVHSGNRYMMQGRSVRLMKVIR